MRQKFLGLVRWVHIVGLAIVIPVGLVAGLEGAAGIVLLFVLMVPLEKMFRRHRQPIRRPGLRTDLTYALLNPAITSIGVGVGLVLTALFFPLWLPAFLFRPLVTAQPTWLLAIEGVLLLDFLIYWTHRLGHEVGFLWRFHAIHHSSEKMDWISGVRQHPFDGVIVVVPAAILLVAGFDLTVVGVAAIVQTVAGLFAHVNVRWRLRPLWKVIMTPEFHHWHHSNTPESIHANYSVGLPIWDIIFGTYYMPEDDVPDRKSD